MKKYDIFILHQNYKEKDTNHSKIKDFILFISKLLQKQFKNELSIISSFDLYNKQELFDFNEIIGNTSIFIVVLSEIIDDEFKQKLQLFNDFLTKNPRNKTISTIYKIIIDQSPENLQEIEFLTNYRNLYLSKINKKQEKHLIPIHTDNEKQIDYYWDMIIELYFQLTKVIHTLNQKEQENNNQKTIYLSECSDDQYDNRQKLKRELLWHNYKILPDKNLPKRNNDYQNAVRECLNSVDLAIHIIGDEYGQVLKQDGQSIVEIQNKIAAVYSITAQKEGKDFSRIIWIPQDLNLTDEKQRLKIEYLKRDDDVQIGAEIIQAPIEKIKSIIKNKLNPVEKKYQPNFDKKYAYGRQKNKIYIVHQFDDKNDFQEITRFFEQQNFDVLPSFFDVEQINPVAFHKYNLIKADYVLIYFTHNEIWLKSKLQEIKKIPGYGKRRDFIEKIILSIVPELEIEKKDFELFYSSKETLKNTLHEITEKLLTQK